jgi:predicted enzyme related to lactoylglutathione lyase
MAGNLVHFEFPADDGARATAFWKDLFGWDFHEYEGSGYHLTDTPQPGGALQTRQEGQTGVTVYFATDDVVAASEKVASLGGSVVMPKSPVPGMGYFAICNDTEGNVFGLWESDESAEAPS